MLWSVTGDSNYNKPSLTSCGDVINTFPLICEWRNIVGMVLRFSCPLTCSCHNSTSGLGERGEQRQGCPETACRDKIQQSLRGIACNDTPFQVLNSTRAEQWRRIASIDDNSGVTVLNPLLELGCDGLRNIS